MKEKDYQSIYVQSCDYEDMCDIKDIRMIRASMLAAQEWADKHPNPKSKNLINNYIK